LTFENAEAKPKTKKKPDHIQDEMVRRGPLNPNQGWGPTRGPRRSLPSETSVKNVGPGKAENWMPKIGCDGIEKWDALGRKQGKARSRAVFGNVKAVSLLYRLFSG